MSRALIVEDDAVYRDALGRALARAGHEPRLVAGVSDAERELAHWTPAIAIVDLKLGDGSGIDVLRAIQRKAPICRAVLLTGHGTIPSTVEAMRAGAIDVLTKPISSNELLAVLESDPPSDEAPTLDAVESQHILATLEASGGNISEAARRLGLHRRTLQRKLNKIPSH